MDLAEIKYTYIAGIKTACVSRRELVDIILTHINKFRGGLVHDPLLVFDINGQAISMANSSKEFNSLLGAADIIHADGQSVVFASKRFSGNSIPERTATTDTIHDIGKLATFSVNNFLLGGEPHVAQKCSAVLESKYKNFSTAGFNDGFFKPSDSQSIINKINASNPDILWVGLGKPKEQKFCVQYKHSIKVPVIITCGGCYNYVTGEYGRAPDFMQKYGLEWLYRLIENPRRLFWRYLTTNTHAIYCILFKK